MKISFLAIIFISVLSYSVNAQSDLAEKQKEINNFTYYEPLFIHKKPNKPKVLYQRFEELSVSTIDSTFSRNKLKYKISQKHNANLKDATKNKLISLFDSIKKKRTNIEFTLDLKSFNKKSNNRYGIFFLIKTKSSLSNRTTAISKIQVETIIIDFVEKQVIFHEKSRNLSPRNNGGYSYTLIKNLDYIYKKIERS